MCMLTAISLPRQMSRMLLPMMLIANSSTNKDGTGLVAFTDKKINVWKSEKAAKSLDDLGAIINEHVTSHLPVLAHVRAASNGMPVTVDNAHPFVGERFTLLHNGRLYKEGEEPATQAYWYGSAADDSVSSDSKEFLEAMEATSKYNPALNGYEVIRDTMKKHSGKFAILVYDSFEDKIYIVRGKTAELHYSEIFETGEKFPGGRIQRGWIVNTKKDTLEGVLSVFKQVYTSTTGVQIEFSAITELEKETAYMVDGSGVPTICGKVPENAVVYTNKHSTSYSKHSYTSTNGQLAVNLSASIWSEANNIYEFMASHFMSISDIDALFAVLFDHGIADATDAEVVAFSSKFIPVISAPKKIRKQIRALIGEHGTVYPYTYYKGVANLEFPWSVNSTEVMNTLLSYLEKRKI